MARTDRARTRWVVLIAALALVLEVVTIPATAAAATTAAPAPGRPTMAPMMAVVAARSAAASAAARPVWAGVSAVRVDGKLRLAGTTTARRVSLFASTPSGGFSSATALGGPILGSAAVVYTAATRGYDVYVIGLDHRLRVRSLANGRWGAWKVLGSGRYQGSPAAVASRDGAQHIIAVGRDRHLYDVIRHGSAVSRPRNLGGAAVGAPAVTFRAGDNALYVFWVGTDGRIHRKAQVDGHWKAASAISSRGFAGGVGAVRDRAGNHFVTAPRTDRHAYLLTGSGRGWSKPLDLGGSVRGTPAVTYAANGQVDVVAAAVDGRIVRRVRAHGHWTGWQTVTGTAAKAAAQTGPQLAKALIARWGGALSGLPAVLADLRAAAAGRTIRNSSSCGRAVRLDPGLLRLLLATTTRYRISINNIVTGHGCDGGWHPRGAAVDFATVTDPRTGAHSNLHTGRSGDNDTLDRQFTGFLAGAMPKGGGVGQRYCGSRGAAAVPAGILFFSDSCTHQHAQLHY